jgi:hypothetical protein
MVTAISKAGTPFSSRQQRHLSFLSEFTTNFSHLPGPKNVVADALSRPSSPPMPCTAVSTAPITLFPLPLSYSEIAQEQQRCPTIPLLQALPSLHISSIPLSPTLNLLGDVSTPTFRPLILKPSDNKFSSMFIPSATLVLGLPVAYFPPVSCGKGWRGTSTSGPGNAFPVKLPRSTSTFLCLLHPFLFLPAVFLTFTLTLSALYLPLKGTPTYSQSLTAPPAG